MTYWPISSPSVFAATKNTNLERAPISHDGTDEASQSGQDDASEVESTNETDDDTSTRGSEGVDEEGKEQKARRTSSPEQFAEDDVHGEVVAIRVTRSGQLFATLTRTTLTIWQTKVRSFLPCNRTSLIWSQAHRYPCFSSTLAAIVEDLWPEHRRPTSSRLSDLRCSNYTRFSDHILPCNRPLVPRVQDTIYRHTWNAFEEEQHYWIQDTASA